MDVHARSMELESVGFGSCAPTTHDQVWIHKWECQVVVESTTSNSTPSNLVAASSLLKFGAISFVEKAPAFQPFPRRSPVTKRLASSSIDHEQIRTAYNAKRTDGIQKLTGFQNTMSPRSLWEETVKATDGNAGKASSILNAWLSMCSDPTYANELFHLATKTDGNFSVAPDEVMLCLLATLMDENDDPRCDGLLKSAEKLSNKDAKGWRKLQAAARRRKRFSTLSEAQSQVQKSLGTAHFHVVYESDELVVVNKPAGVSVTPEKQKNRMDLPQAIHMASRSVSTINRGVVHRLDRGTSGCWVVPKSNRSHARLLKEFFTRRIRKTYQCLVQPSLNTPVKGVLEELVDGKPAYSSYQILRQLQCGTLLQVETKTGRKHQVRVHCSRGLGSPIIGDTLYGGAPNDNLFLHAYAMEFLDSNIRVEAPLPLHWDSMLA